MNLFSKLCFYERTLSIYVQGIFGPLQAFEYKGCYTEIGRDFRRAYTWRGVIHEEGNTEIFTVVSYTQFLNSTLKCFIITFEPVRIFSSYLNTKQVQHFCLVIYAMMEKC